MNPIDLPTDLTEADFFEYIAHGAVKLTARDIHRLIAELPDLRGQFSKLRESPYPGTERQLQFLADVVDRVWTQAHLDLPYGAALEAAFAIAYFTRETDLIPDTLGSVGLIDDIAVVQAVFARNQDAFGGFREATGLDWTDAAGNSKD